MRSTRLFLHICFVLALLGCGQDNAKSAETPPAAAADEPLAQAAPSAPTEVKEGAPVEAEQPTTEAAPQKTAPAGKHAVDVNAVCLQVCDRTEKLNCGPTEQCMAACAAANDGTICGAEMSTFMRCALAHPVEHWECTEDGVAAIKDAYCDREQAAVMQCFEKTAG